MNVMHVKMFLMCVKSVTNVYVLRVIYHVRNVCGVCDVCHVRNFCTECYVCDVCVVCHVCNGCHAFRVCNNFFFCDDVLMRGTASATKEVQQIAHVRAPLATTSGGESCGLTDTRALNNGRKPCALMHDVHHAAAFL